MKKLMFVAAIAAMAGSAFCIESANTVGYMTPQLGGEYESLLYGNMFVPVSSADGSWQLSDVTPTGMDPTGDNIQILNDDLDAEYEITYIDAAFCALAKKDESNIGWWDMNDPFGDAESRLDDMTIAAGTGFLCGMYSGNDVTFTFSGEVANGAIQVTNSDGAGGTIESPIICNPTAKTITLAQIDAEGFDPTGDNIQFLNDDLEAEYEVTYIDEAFCALAKKDTSYVGWWDMNDPFGDAESRLDDLELAPGAAVLGGFYSGNEVSLTFPSAL
jgi:hypothetical protein